MKVEFRMINCNPGGREIQSGCLYWTFNMEKFQNKYRMPSARANWWDYSAGGVYFIPICTAQRLHYFGEVHDGKMILSEIGEIAESCRKQIPDHFPFVKLDAFVVMPNHFHGILIIDPVAETLRATSQQNAGGIQSSPIISNSLPEETLRATSLQNRENEKMARISPKRGSLGSVIRSYKSAATLSARIIRADFSWQSRFHDKIILNENEFYQIRFYIETNPENWKPDGFLT